LGTCRDAAAGGALPEVIHTLARCITPPCLPRAALSRGLQHANVLVRWASLQLVAGALAVLDSVLEGIGAGSGSGTGRVGGAAAAIRDDGQREALEASTGCLAEVALGVEGAVRRALPDPQTLVALLTMAGGCKENGDPGV
jgi:hypothetical protein